MKGCVKEAVIHQTVSAVMALGMHAHALSCSQWDNLFQISNIKYTIMVTKKPNSCIRYTARLNDQLVKTGKDSWKNMLTTGMPSKTAWCTVAFIRDVVEPAPATAWVKEWFCCCDKERAPAYVRKVAHAIWKGGTSRTYLSRKRCISLFIVHSWGSIQIEIHLWRARSTDRRTSTLVLLCSQRATTSALSTKLRLTELLALKRLLELHKATRYCRMIREWDKTVTMSLLISTKTNDEHKAMAS